MVRVDQDYIRANDPAWQLQQEVRHVRRLVSVIVGILAFMIIAMAFAVVLMWLMADQAKDAFNTLNTALDVVTQRLSEIKGGG